MPETQQMNQIVADLKKPEETPVPDAQEQIAHLVTEIEKETQAVKLKVYQQAVPFQFYAEVPAPIMIEAFDKLWAERKSTIPPQVLDRARKGFRANTPVSDLRNRIVTMMGGEQQFYETALLSVVNDAFKNLEPKPQIEIFTWMSVDMRKEDKNNYAISAIGYFEPEVLWQVPARPKNFKVIFPEEAPDFVENAVDSNLQALATQHKVEVANDDLAITMGFETLAQLKGTIRKRIEDKMTSDRETQALDAIRDFLFTQTKISPIPETWRQYKAQEAYHDAIKRFKNEDQFIKTLGMNSREEVIRYYSSQMASALAEQLVFRNWGKDVVEGPNGLHDITTFFPTVRKHILQNMEIEYTSEAGAEIKVEGIY